MNNVFISYSHDAELKDKALEVLVSKLLEDDIKVCIDSRQLKPGMDISMFMEQSITNSDYVLCICTDDYKQKADTRSNGVGYEARLAASEMLLGNDNNKYIPVILDNKYSFPHILPNFLSGRLGVNLALDNNNYDNEYKDLLTTIKEEEIVDAFKDKDFLKNKRNQTDLHNNEYKNTNYEDIKILGVITNEVTMPKLDGTRGSALYKIPLRLSQAPSKVWSDMFVKNFDNPPEFTTMHRPEIASISLNKLILDGTTIDELRDYHMKTIKLALGITNEEYRSYIQKLEKQEQDRKKVEAEHKDTVLKISSELDFN